MTVTPNHRTGRQAPDTAPAQQPDPTLVELLRQHHVEDPEIVALVALRHGYRQPKRVTDYTAVTGMPPTAGLIDAEGMLWSAASIDEDSFADSGPWHVIYVPDVTDIETES